MALLGNFREFYDDILFRLKANEPLNPATVQLSITPNGEPEEPLAVVEDDDTDFVAENEFKNDPPWDTTGKPLGLAVTHYEAEDKFGNLSQRDDAVNICNSYGRNYGKDYGNGL